jgi:hypothetical protein
MTVLNAEVPGWASFIAITLTIANVAVWAAILGY